MSSESIGRVITEEDFHRLHPKLVATFRKLGAYPEEARDLTQETLLRVHKGLDAFEGRSQLDTWAVSIAKRVWLQHCRDQMRLKRSADEVPLDAAWEKADPPRAAGDVEAHLLTQDVLRKVSRVLRSLPEAMRQALILHVRGHKYRRIAVLMGISENRVASLIHEARKKLRRATGAAADSAS